MFEVGHVFKRNGIDYCVIDIIKYNNKEYLLLSNNVGGIDYDFYLLSKPNDSQLRLSKVTDEKLELQLMNLFYDRMGKGEKNG